MFVCNLVIYLNENELALVKCRFLLFFSLICMYTEGGLTGLQWHVELFN